MLFTDLVGSTALRATLGEEGADELRRAHDALLGRCVSARGGVVMKGGGDGISSQISAAATEFDQRGSAPRSEPLDRLPPRLDRRPGRGHVAGSPRPADPASRSLAGVADVAAQTS